MINKLSPATRVGLAIAIATGLYGVSFGALSVASGLSLWQTMVLSLLMFSGGSQFGFIGVISAGGSGVAAMSTAVLLGIRNGVYGMQINALLRPRGLTKLAAAQVTIDESTAVCTSQVEVREQQRGFWVTGIAIFVLWNLFTFLGAIVGDAAGDPKQWGLDGAAVGGFLGLVWPRLKNGEAWAIAGVALVVTVVLTPWIPSGLPILAAALVVATIGFIKGGHRAQRPEDSAPVIDDTDRRITGEER